MARKKDRVITDNTNFAHKKEITYDSFYSENNKQASDTGIVSSAPYKGSKRFFAIVSTSDKDINDRIYTDKSWRDTVENGTWQGPIYPKPTIRNHNLYSGIPFGRIKDCFYVQHDNLKSFNNKKEKINKKVLDYYNSLNCFKEGTGTVVAEFTCDELTAERIINKLDITVSQSSYFENAICNICGMDYFGGGCNHYSGREYEIKNEDGEIIERKKCLVITSDFEPIELSIVLKPANDTSIIFVLDEADDNNEKNGTDGAGFDENSKTCNNPDIQDNKKQNDKKTEGIMAKVLVKDLIKEKLSKAIKDENKTEKIFNDFAKVFDSIEDEKTLGELKSLTDTFAEIYENTVNDLEKNIDKMKKQIEETENSQSDQSKPAGSEGTGETQPNPAGSERTGETQSNQSNDSNSQNNPEAKPANPEGTQSDQSNNSNSQNNPEPNQSNDTPENKEKVIKDKKEFFTTLKSADFVENKKESIINKQILKLAENL